MSFIFSKFKIRLFNIDCKKRVKNVQPFHKLIINIDFQFFIYCNINKLTTVIKEIFWNSLHLCFTLLNYRLRRKNPCLALLKRQNCFRTRNDRWCFFTKWSLLLTKKNATYRKSFVLTEKVSLPLQTAPVPFRLWPSITVTVIVTAVFYTF